MTESLEWTDLDKRTVDTARVLAADAVHKTGNGHPGTAMSLAPIATLLFQRVLRHDPADPNWIGRDRFVLSAGHSSLTLYTQLFFSGYGLELSDMESFRTENSLTPGHPEYGHTVGVETTTGPLGQGLATAVGMAMDGRYVREMLDAGAKPGESVFDHHIWVIAGDGCIEEGITSEASSLAGHQQLGNLTVIYDDNHISIEGNTEVAFSEDVEARYRAYGWDTIHVEVLPDGDVDVQGVYDAMLKARESDKPTLIRVTTIIGWPAPTKQNSHDAHGADLGAEEIEKTKEILGFDPDKTFEVSDEVLDHAREVKARGAELHAEWDKKFDEWRDARPKDAKLLDRIQSGKLPEGLEDAIPTFEVGSKVATRQASGKVINGIASVMPEFWGGSADLASSNNTSIDDGGSFLPFGNNAPAARPNGRILHFGIREHAMGAALNGIALSRLTRVFGGTFFTFSDYMRGAVRLSALMDVPVTYVWTHDSVGLGEDGPTHQPIEHLASLRAMPNINIVRPADGNETAIAWRHILERQDAVGLILSRQGLPVFEADEGVTKGAYIRVKPSADPKVLLIATGSEVQWAVGAAEVLEGEGIPTQVVSMPCLEWFDEQDDDYKEQVIPSSVKARVTVEAGVAMPWYRFLGEHGRAISIEHFGESADGALLMTKYGFTVDNVVAKAKESLESVENN